VSYQKPSLDSSTRAKYSNYSISSLRKKIAESKSGLQTSLFILVPGFGVFTIVSFATEQFIATVLSLIIGVILCFYVIDQSDSEVKRLTLEIELREAEIIEEKIEILTKDYNFFMEEMNAKLGLSLGNLPSFYSKEESKSVGFASLSIRDLYDYFVYLQNISNFFERKGDITKFCSDITSKASQLCNDLFAAFNQSRATYHYLSIVGNYCASKYVSVVNTSLTALKELY